MRACILIRTCRGKAEKVAKRVQRIRGVSRAWVVMGLADVVARAEVANFDELVELTRRMGRIRCLRSSETLPEWEAT